ncbi:hypothetical protein FRAHR75_410027 [Frankia sp. Hr75.2]|nr:hypothetical protein FRAHR75_410027 [Frankia sp. Hr75.2]
MPCVLASGPAAQAILRGQGVSPSLVRGHVRRWMPPLAARRTCTCTAPGTLIPAYDGLRRDFLGYPCHVGTVLRWIGRL